MAKKRIVTATVNGREEEFLCQPRQTLLEVLRNTLGLTGAKEGCSNGNCGACSVVIDGKAVNTCMVLAVEAEGANIETIEGLAPVDGLDPLQEAFLENAALQCGICTPGFIMSAKAFLDENPNPTEEEIRFSMAGNLCRCTGYDKIVRAIQQAAETRCAQSASCEKETV
ncbi:(2Fe-2S)-binding protein [Gimesia sp.]|uniref:(2Fe-2S)-binding protein n=1 Tax=Gimesia sp. TaxID=2024833 RepID=UPI000C422407|nr:(2Fe-2S)-binding protein [Gimesia sp.]MAX40922.1 ferredoxin [Gimesia sp.]HBL47539.1 ferredoxin [Planctomycetaceae bacterium]|tara:strand:- start:2765 stop:3271 length:507 start_codon:yes stop_codon:yes gene_type:complete